MSLSPVPFEIGFPFAISQSILGTVLELSKTTLRHGPSLHALKDSKVVIFTVTVCYSKRIQGKISKGKRWRGRNSKETRSSFQKSFPSAAAQDGDKSSAMVCDNTCKVLLWKKPGAQGVYCGPVTEAHSA